MNSETVDLIATGASFAKWSNFHATPDSLAAGASFQDRWKWDQESHPQFTDALRDDPKNASVWTVIESARNAAGRWSASSWSSTVSRRVRRTAKIG